MCTYVLTQSSLWSLSILNKNIFRRPTVYYLGRTKKVAYLFISTLEIDQIWVVWRMRWAEYPVLLRLQLMLCDKIKKMRRHLALSDRLAEILLEAA